MPNIQISEIIMVVFTAVVLGVYHIYFYIKVRRDPLETAIGITNHAREMWVKEVMRDKRDLLAVQTLRNQVMASTFLASTSIIICLGAFNAAFRPGGFSEISHALNLFGTKTEALWMFKLLLIGVTYFISFFNFTLCIRYYNHVSFMINTFQQNDPSVSEKNIVQVINHGAFHYTAGMRGFYLSVPLAMWMFGPLWMLTGSLVMVAVLFFLDKEA